MTARKPMTVKLQKLLSSRVAYALDHVAHAVNSTVRRHVGDGLEKCARGERIHRKMGRGLGSYRTSVEVASTLMMGRVFFTEAPEWVNKTAADIAGYRDDHQHMIFAYALTQAAERKYGTRTVPEALVKLEPQEGSELARVLAKEGFTSALEALAAWDYSRDCADNA